MAKSPKMISTKDLLYICDMFNWNQTLNKKVSYYLEDCNDEDLCKYLNEILEMTTDNSNNLIKLLESGEEYGK